MYKIKRGATGNTSRYKAQLVEQGYNQQSWLDLFDTFSPVIKMTTIIWLILSIALHFKWQIQQLDVKSAFLRSFILENIFISQPQGFVINHFPNHVCYLSMHARFSQLILMIQGFVMSRTNNSLFVCHESHSVTILLVYVDDILPTGNDSTIIKTLLTALHNQFAMRHLGELKHFLGIDSIH